MAPNQQATRAVAEAPSDDPRRTAAVEAGVTTALREVTAKLDKPGLSSRERMRLLQRQAELGDLRDEMALRTRRRLFAR